MNSAGLDRVLSAKVYTSQTDRQFPFQEISEHLSAGRKGEDIVARQARTEGKKFFQDALDAAGKTFEDPLQTKQLVSLLGAEPRDRGRRSKKRLGLRRPKEPSHLELRRWATRSST